MMEEVNRRLFLKIERPILQNQDIDVKAVKRSIGKQNVLLDEILVNNTYKCRLRSFVLRTIPSITWLSSYNWKEDLVKDVSAGCTVAIMNIPQGMAYALLANVPPVVGIYMAFFPVLVYMFLGTSRHVSMGSFAVVCLMTGKIVNVQLAMQESNIMSTGLNDTSRYTSIQIATAVSFAVGGFQILMFLCRLGFICSLLSDTLVSGFTAGAAIHVFTSQIKDVFGFNIVSYNGLFQIINTYVDIFKNITTINWAATIISVITILILILNNIILKPWFKNKCIFPVPIELIVVLIATVVSKILDIHGTYGLRIVGHISVGIPEPEPPPFALIPAIALDSLIIAIIAYIVTISMALIFAQKNKYEIDPNQELLAQGAGNIVGSFFSCAPFAASLSRSVIQETVGGKTQLASLVSCTILLSILLWLGPFFEPLPRCVLASLIIVALESVIMQVTKLPSIWKLSILDGIVWIITYLTVIFVEIDIGLLVGLGVSLISLLIQGLKPNTCLLSRVPETDIYVDKSKYMQTVDPPGGKIVRYSGGINFANRGYFKEGIYSLLNIHPKKILKEGSNVNNKVYSIEIIEKVRYVILDISGIHYVDPSGAKAIKTVAEEFHELNIPLYIAGTSEPVYESFRQNGLVEANVFTFFPTVHDAVLYAQYTLNGTPSTTI